MGKPGEKVSRLVVAQLLGDPGLTDAERAAMAGCSVKTITRIKAELRQDVAALGKDALERYQMHIEERIPVGLCVDKWLELLNCGHRPTEANALKRLEQLRGVVTAKEARKAEEQVSHGPMFIFPPGSEPTFNIHERPLERLLDEKSSASEPVEAEVVRVSEDDE